ncbi:MAG: hypothetical protein QOE97_2257 [Pseudonocardiales bacterium]|nr:hypothetical protein [Pseudonocardiales bacterium]
MGRVATKDSTPSRPRSSAKTQAQKRLAGQRALAAAGGNRSSRRRRLFITLSPIVAVVVVVAVLIGARLGSASGSPASGQSVTPASAAVVGEVTAVPATVLNTVGAGSVTTLPTAITGTPLTAANGQPQILYVGAEYCPYCAAERWGVVVALSRFGTFANLGATASSPSDVYPSTATFTFHGASYTSSQLAFSAVETQSNQVVNGSYTPLDTLSAADQALMTKYDPSGGIPFIDIGGKFLISGASYSPAVLQGKTQAQIAAALTDPTSAIAKAIDGTANVITAAVCASTGNQPASVCTAPGVVAAAARLP